MSKRKHSQMLKAVNPVFNRVQAEHLRNRIIKDRKFSARQNREFVQVRQMVESFVKPDDWYIEQNYKAMSQIKKGSSTEEFRKFIIAEFSKSRFIAEEKFGTRLLQQVINRQFYLPDVQNRFNQWRKKKWMKSIKIAK